MKRAPLFILAVAVVAAACQDAVTSTSPQLSADLAYSFTGNPPPPPIDTGARGRFVPAFLREDPTSGLLQPRFSILESASPQQRQTIASPLATRQDEISIDPGDFFLPVKYELDKKRTNGHVDFKKIKHSKAVLKECNVELHHGDELKGHGKLEIQTTGGRLVIDCESVEQPPTSWMEPCGDGFTLGERCFHLVFDDATLNGVPGSVEVITSCDPDDVNNEEEGSCPNFNED